MNIETYTTKHLQLKKLTPDIFADIFTNFNDDALALFLNLKTREAIAKERERYTKGVYSPYKNLVWFHLIETATNEIIGSCGFHTWYKDHSRAEIGYNIIEDANKQKGLMSEAVAFVLDYGFNTMQLNRVEAFVGPNNIPSLKIMSKFGFEKEGYCREHYCFDGVIDDSVLFALFKKNYLIANCR
jgi:ribosomal-protein-alanine N-acetyltransferase